MDNPKPEPASVAKPRLPVRRGRALRARLGRAFPCPDCGGALVLVQIGQGRLVCPLCVSERADRLANMQRQYRAALLRIADICEARKKNRSLEALRADAVMRLAYEALS